MILQIQVNPLDGKITDAWDCPVARAVNRVCDEGVEASVNHDYVSLHKGFRTHKIEFAEWVKEKIIAIDLEKVVEPFTFVLDIPLGYHK